MQTYNEVKRILDLKQIGNDHEDFMRYNLPPLITEEMTVYKELEDVIHQS